MSRPAVSVVMPFAGVQAEAESALAALAALATGPDDELILVDNSSLGLVADPVRVIAAAGERSPSHARNVGAEHARRDWILFLDADCRAPADLLERYFAAPLHDDVGALAGEVVPARTGSRTLAARYGETRSFLSQSAHLSHPYLPRAVAANLLVRRVAFDAIGGFYEGVRAAEDTDFSWRLQRAGWRLVACPEAGVEHEYRTSLSALRRQWRGYAAGRAWLARRYSDFVPEPALRRAATRGLGRVRRRTADERIPATASDAPSARSEHPAPSPRHSRWERSQFAAVDALLGLEELGGFVLSNRPAGSGATAARELPARVVLVADRFPARGDPLADFARSLAGARVEAAARPEAFDPGAARSLPVSYREDDGTAVRILSLVRLLVRHPLRCLLDRMRRGADQPGLRALAPAAVRLSAEPGARVHILGGGHAASVARRLARLVGRPLEEGPL